MIKIPDPDDPVNLAGGSERKDRAVGHSVEMLEISVCVCVLKGGFCFVLFLFFKRKHKHVVIVNRGNYFVDVSNCGVYACWW